MNIKKTVYNMTYQGKHYAAFKEFFEYLWREMCREFTEDNYTTKAAFIIERFLECMPLKYINKNALIEEIEEAYKKEQERQNKIIDPGAAIAHDQWSGWMKYLFEKCEINTDGTATIPQWAVERWTRQMNTDYANLPEEEKQSDRAEAQRYIDWIRKD